MTTLSNSEEFSFSDARTHLAEIANGVAYAGKRVIITRKGKRLVAMVPIEDLETLEAIEDRIDLDDAKKALSDAKKSGTISWESIKRKLDL
jgi:prevent-host-death family protein